MYENILKISQLYFCRNYFHYSQQNSGKGTANFKANFCTSDIFTVYECSQNV